MTDEQGRVGYQKHPQFGPVLVYKLAGETYLLKLEGERFKLVHKS